MLWHKICVARQLEKSIFSKLSQRLTDWILIFDCLDKQYFEQDI